MDLSVNCSCGERIAVTAAHAGSEIRCTCGLGVAVPSLGELRRNAGHARYEIGVADRIRQRVDAGALPSENACVKCGVPTADVLWCIIECERPWSTGSGFWKTFFVLLLTPVWIYAKVLADHKNPEVQGREVVVETPLRVCRNCQAKLNPKRDLAGLLRKTPLYDELLTEYPRATISEK
jgi:hypothetical protein